MWLPQYTQRYFDNSLEYGTPQAERISKAAKDNNIFVSMGLSERSGGSLYIAPHVVDRHRRTRLDDNCPIFSASRSSF